eukprot:1788835-Rhodomonas_salina.4
MSCSVLTYYIMLCACYAVCSTTPRAACSIKLRYRAMRMLCGVCYSATVSCYARAMRCPVLSYGMGLQDLDKAAALHRRILADDHHVRTPIAYDPMPYP